MDKTELYEELLAISQEMGEAFVYESRGKETLTLLFELVREHRIGLGWAGYQGDTMRQIVIIH